MHDDQVQAAFALLESLGRRRAFDEEAVRELVSLGVSALPALEAQLAIEDPSLRRLALRALARLGARSSVAPLLNFAAQVRDGDAELLVLALRGAIAALGPDDARKTWHFLASFERHQNHFVRAAAADGLGKVAAPEAEHVLLGMASDSDEFVAERALSALEQLQVGPDAEEPARQALPVSLLGRLASRRAGPRLEAIAELVKMPDAAQRVAATLASDDHDLIRRSLLQAAIQLRSADLYSTLRALIEDPEIPADERVLAFHALLVPEGVDEREIAAMVRRFCRHSDPFVRSAAAAMGMRSARPAVIEVAVARLDDREGHVREATARAFRDWPSAVAAAAVIDRMRYLHGQGFVAPGAADEWAALLTGLAALRSRGVYSGPELTEHLLSAVGSPVSVVAQLSGAALDGLGELSDAHPRRLTEAANALLHAADVSSIERGVALAERAPSDIDYVVPGLVAALYRSDMELTIRIARLLRTSAHPAAIDVCHRLSMSPDGSVRAAVGAAEAQPPVAVAEPKPAKPATSGVGGHVAPRSMKTARAHTGRPEAPPELPDEGPRLLQEPPASYREDLAALSGAGFETPPEDDE